MPTSLQITVTSDLQLIFIWQFLSKRTSRKYHQIIVMFFIVQLFRFRMNFWKITILGEIGAQVSNEAKTKLFVEKLPMYDAGYGNCLKACSKSGYTSIKSHG